MAIHPGGFEVVTHCGFDLHFPNEMLVAQMVKHLLAMLETQVNPWAGKIPCRRKWQSTPLLLPGKCHGRRSLVGCSPWGPKELDTTEWLHFNADEVGCLRVLIGLLHIFFKKCLLKSFAHFSRDFFFFFVVEL